MTAVDWVKALLSVVTTGLGVLFGLLGSGAVSWLREKRAYQAMLVAIVSEGRNNREVLKSFRKFYKEGLVLREFSTTATDRCVGDLIFVNHVKPAELEIIYEYLRNLRLANSYRERAERLRSNQGSGPAKGWLSDIIREWEKNLEQCEASIERVIALKVRDSQRFVQPIPASSESSPRT